MQNNPDLSPRELEISEAVAEEARAAPAQKVAPPQVFSRPTCAICVEETRRLYLPPPLTDTCSRCIHHLSHTVGAHIQSLDTEIRYRMFQYASGRTEATSRCYMEIKAVDYHIMERVLHNLGALPYRKKRRPRSVKDELYSWCIVSPKTVSTCDSVFVSWYVLINYTCPTTCY